MSLLIIAHWIGCVNFMLVRLYDFPEESWVGFADLEDAPISIQYSWCFFKALAQLIGVGFDIPPIVNTSCLERTPWCTVEHWITLTCLYIGSIYVALLISSISYVIVNMDKGSSNLSMQLWTLNEYLGNKKVPYEIRDRVRNFFRLRFAEGKMYNESEVLGLLPPNLKNDILSHNQKLLFEQVPLLRSGLDPKEPQDKSADALRSLLAPMLEKRIMFQYETIFEEGSVGSEIFFIVTGIVQICSDSIAIDDDDNDIDAGGENGGVYKSISDGCYFGDVAVLLNTRRTASTRARTNLVLSVISQADVTKVLEEFPEVNKYMKEIAKKRLARLEFLNSDEIDLTKDQVEDLEDSQTKYFVKLMEHGKKQEKIFRHRTISRATSRASHRNASEEEDFLSELENGLESVVNSFDTGGHSFDTGGHSFDTGDNGGGPPLLETIHSSDDLEDRYQSPKNASSSNNPLMRPTTKSPPLIPGKRPKKATKGIQFRKNDSYIPKKIESSSLPNGAMLPQIVEGPSSAPPDMYYSSPNRSKTGDVKSSQMINLLPRENNDDEVKSSSLDRAPT
jgi:CRP-like cAMP-binding protein